ncbi:zinc-binding alcohol dehydrogenase family protein [Dyadobacter subterraneus]|uniref:Zinc-binding dehydrogenase n=1 Tax=Dyadobacter subterraneus TaxID=2773304 RepID=A0ABR9W8W3_9BACT|nr:zinc-binding dehydrogenase [Dyadobacter subterraneus]MBE9461924.1 zinc-binding dehydrogenase [Dyadobacter subterraneus]
MKALIFDKIGIPQQVLYLAELPIPVIGDNDVLVRMVGASINPGDFLFIQNLYPEPKKPVFPHQVGGGHGAGTIEKVGKNVMLKPGAFVAFSYYNTWSEYVAVPAEYLIELPKDFPLEKAAQINNLVSAWDLLTDSGVEKGQWLALTAGNSSLSLIISQYAAQRGIKVVSIVRKQRPELGAQLTKATETIELSKLEGSLKDKIMAVTGGWGVNGIIDNVGGPQLADLIKSVAFGSKLIVNGGMSREKFELHNFDILMTNLTIQAHIYRYLFAPVQSSDFTMLSDIIEITKQPDFYVHIGGKHQLEDFRSAVEATIQNPEKGKRFFVF